MSRGDPEKRKLTPQHAVGAIRTAILNAARVRFAHENYDRVHLSEIADDADVDQALVEEYFGSKGNLLTEVLADAIYPSVLMDGDRATFGLRLMSAFADGKPHEQELDYFLLLLRIAMVPALQPMLRTMIQNRLIVPFTAWIGGADAPLRARLIHTLLIGASMQTVLSGDVPMADGDRDRCRDFLARILQGLIDGDNLDKADRDDAIASESPDAEAIMPETAPIRKTRPAPGNDRPVKRSKKI